MNVSTLILPIILIIVFYFSLIRPQQKRAKEHREVIGRIEVGQRIATIGGIRGTVKVVDETAVVITVNGHGTETIFEKPAIEQVNPS